MPKKKKVNAADLGNIAQKWVDLLAIQIKGDSNFIF